jgi:ArsR family transcriptional regulator
MNIQEFEYKAGVAAQLLKALASRPRLMVLCHLADGEKSVGEIAGLTGLRMSAVSQNLAVLRAEGLVAQRRDGTTIHYRLADPTAKKVIEVLYRAFCTDRTTKKPRRKTRPAGQRVRKASPLAK